MGPLAALGIALGALAGYELVLKPKPVTTPTRVAFGAKTPPIALGGNPNTQTGAPLSGALIGLGTTLIGSGTTIARDIYNSPSSSPADFSYGYQIPDPRAADPTLVNMGDGTYVDEGTGYIVNADGSIEY